MPGRVRRRVCLEVGCPTIHSNPRGRCDDCERAYQRSRGTTTERGYGWKHQREGGRAIAGAEWCARCGEPFTVDNPATRGHIVALADGGQSVRENYQAECHRCNIGKPRVRFDS